MRDFINIVKTVGQYLYHGTSIYGAAAILHMKVIQAGDDDDGPWGVSLTTERGVAVGFAEAVDFREVDNAKVDGCDYVELVGRPWPKHGCILVFNGATLADAVTLVPHRWDGCDSEHEVRAKGEGFHIDRHLTGIITSTASLDWWIAAYTAEWQRT